jgi:hypothetical protein
MKRFFKRFFIFGMVFLLLLYATLMLLPKLTPEVDDSDLAIDTPTISDADNGYALLSDALGALWKPEDVQYEIANMALGTNWNPQLATAIIESNRAVLDAFDAALRAPAFQAPKPTLKYLGKDHVEWRTVAYLVCLQAQQSFRDGRESDGYDRALDVARLGGRMQESNGGILNYIVGCSIRSLGLLTIRHHLSDCTLSAEQLSLMAAKVLKLEASSEALTNTFKVEYQFQLESLAAMRAGKLPGQPVNSLERLKLLPVYNHRRTQYLYANESRALIVATALPYSKRQLPPSPTQNRTRLMLSGNGVGEVLFLLSQPSNRKTLVRKSHDRVQVQATATLVAMRAFQIEHGVLPSQLTQLVPKYLAAVPSDDFCGEPLRFNPESKIVYSVGEDGVDNRGVTTDTLKNTPDHIFPIEF